MVLVTWQCAALRAFRDPSGQTPSEPVDNLHGWSMYGAQDIAYTEDDTSFLAHQRASRPQESVESGNETVLELPYMFGRLGDALNQLLGNILWAERHNATAVHVFHRGFKKVDGFLDIPKDSQGRRMIWIDRKAAVDLRMDTWFGITASHGCRKFPVGNSGASMISCYADPRTRRRVMTQYVKPLLVPLARTDERSRDNGLDELIIHIRSGDAWSSEQSPWGTPLFEYRMPPCAFYDKIIETGNKGGAFQHVRVVTQADRNNPCVDLIRERHAECNVTVQRTSREEDAAALINARHLVTSQSYFAWNLAEMSERLETLFITDQVPEFYETVVPCGSPGDPKVVKVTTPGLEAVWSPPAKKREWMVDYSEGALSVAEC